MVYNSMINHQFELSSPLSLRKVDTTYQRGDFSNPFYTAIINNTSKLFIKEKYGVDLTQHGGGLWIREQVSPYIVKEENNVKSNNYGFLYMPQDDMMKIILFPKKVNKYDSLEERIVTSLKDRYEQKPYTPPEQLPLPLGLE